VWAADFVFFTHPFPNYFRPVEEALMVNFCPFTQLPFWDCAMLLTLVARFVERFQKSVAHLKLVSW
jgi:hypothetical protein